MRQFTAMILLLACAACGPKPPAAEPQDVQPKESATGLDLGEEGTRAINLLFDAAFSGDEFIREAALTELMRLAPHVPGTLESLHEGLSEGAASRRSACAHAFAMYYGKLGKTLADHDALPALLDALRDEDPGVRAAAALAVGTLGEEGEEGVQSLTFAMGKDTEQVRIAAIQALGQIGPPADRAAPQLVDYMLSGDTYLGEAAARALAGIRSADVQEQIVDTLGHGNADLRMMALTAISGYGAQAPEAIPLITQMASSPDERVDVRAAAIEALGQMGSAAREASMQTLFTILEGPDDSLARKASGALSRMGPEVVPAMIQMTSHESATVRRLAILALMDLDAPADQVLSVYTDRLDDEDPEVVFTSVTALGHLGHDAAPSMQEVAALMAELAPRVDYTHLWEQGLEEGTLDPVPDTLVRMGPESVTALQQALGHEMPIVRWRAARALGLLGASAEPAVPTLMQAVTDEDVFVRKDAVRALARIGPMGAPAALQALTGEDAFLHVDAVWGLGLVVNDIDGALELLLQTLSGADLELRMEAARALGNAGEAGVDPLLAALDGAPPELRDIIIRSLGRIGTPARKAVPVLVNMWGSLGSAEEARMLIPTALGHVLLPE